MPFDQDGERCFIVGGNEVLQQVGVGQPPVSLYCCHGPQVL
jgi:hypothetical protein